MRKFVTPLLFSVAIIIAAYLLADAIINRNNGQGKISVTGLGKADFTSDLIVWEGSFSRQNKNLQQAYNDLENDKKVISDYLISKGISENELVFKAVQSTKITEPKYVNGKFSGNDFLGYRLTQYLQIDSKNVELVETTSREVTELLNKGIEFYSQPPRYYYTKLADLKVEMISKATADAKARAEKIAENSGGNLGPLVTARMGVFQITGQNSNENYSWGGSFNTSSKEKTASITMKLDYKSE